jgi:prevent-host-death family protein
MNKPKEASKAKNQYKTLGKSDARKQFLPIVDSVAQGIGPVEITDYGEVVAVLLSKHDFDWMQAQTVNKLKPKRRLCGLGQLLGDLQEGSKEIVESMQEGLKKSAKKL